MLSVFEGLFIAFPLPLAFFFIIAAIVSKKQTLKRRYLLLSLITLLIFSNPFLLSRFARAWDIKPVPLKSSGPYSCAIVLGGFSGEDSHGKGYFNTSADRFIQGLKLITTGKVSHLIISGGNSAATPNTFTESGWARTQLRELNVPDTCILIETHSRNTIENAEFSKLIFKNRNLQPPYLLVTSAFHMRRSLLIFKKAGIQVISYPCNYLVSSGGFSFNDFIPQAETLFKWNFYIKEVIGTVVNYVKWL